LKADFDIGIGWQQALVSMTVLAAGITATGSITAADKLGSECYTNFLFIFEIPIFRGFVA